jgi:hypothetical protein
LFKCNAHMFKFWLMLAGDSCLDKKTGIPINCLRSLY